MVFADPKWDYRTLNFDRDIKRAEDELGPILNSTNPDLRRFQARGGKMIQYHGWADAAVAPVNSINYYESVSAYPHAQDHGRHERDSLRRTQTFYRLFTVPGMAHCAGGPGADVFGNKPGVPPPTMDAEHDVVSALDRWVESNVPPENIVATKTPTIVLPWEWCVATSFALTLRWLSGRGRMAGTTQPTAFANSPAAMGRPARQLAIKV
jgi:feruloyl esterase